MVPAPSDRRQVNAVEHGEVVNRRAVEVCGAIPGEIDAGGAQHTGVRAAVRGASSRSARRRLPSWSRSVGFLLGRE
jgi:hypothetical protein